MAYVSGRFTSDDGLALHFQNWAPQGVPRGLIVLVHGFGEHAGRYTHLVQSLVSAGYSVYGHDQRGHGRSPGQRGYIRAWSQYLDDLLAFTNFILARNPALPLFLFGHSMGALVVLDYLVSGAGECRGAILSGTPLTPVGVGSPILAWMARLLSIVAPRVPLPLRLDETALSRDPKVGAAYRADPLVHGWATPRWGMEATKALARVQAEAHAIQLPVLFLHGEADRLTSAQGPEQFFAQIPAPGKSLIVYPQAYHELHNDLDHRRVAEDLIAWLEASLSSRLAAA